MKEHDLAEIDVRQGGQRIRIRRHGEVDESRVPDATAAARALALAAAASAAGASQSSGEVAEQNITVIKSPMVGTFYNKPNPDAQTYVKLGDTVGPDTVVCIIEAMKVFNEIPAEVAGRVVAMLVDNEEPVEFGKPLFKIDTSA
jgi:acetyl-CoA carboxylase biotin carboxyl carrier protein